jgi:hypothetical protein
MCKTLQLFFFTFVIKKCFLLDSVMLNQSRKNGEIDDSFKVYAKILLCSLYFLFFFLFDPFGFWNFNFNLELYFFYFSVLDLREERKSHWILMVNKVSIDIDLGHEKKSILISISFFWWRESHLGVLFPFHHLKNDWTIRA